MTHAVPILAACSIVALAAPWRLWRFLLWRPLAREFPRLSFKFSLAVTAYTLFVLAVALHRPALLPVVAIASLAYLAWDAWTSRPAFGRSRGWPPGSLARLPLRSFVDPSHYRKLAARHGPIFKTRFFFIPQVCVVGLPRIIALMQEAGPRLRAPIYPLNRFVPGGFLRSLKPDLHARYRAVFMEIFSEEVVRACAPRMAATIRAKLDEVAALPAPKGILMRPHLYRLVFDVWLQLFYGIPPGTAEGDRLRALYKVMDVRFRHVWSSSRVGEAVREISEIARARADAYVAGRARGETVPVCFLSNLALANPEAAADPTVLGNFIFIFHTSWGDISGFSQWAVKNLSVHSAWTDHLREELDRGPLTRDAFGRDLIDAFIMETFRSEQSELLSRFADEDIPFEGYVIPRGWGVRMCIWESHRDPAVFPDPDAFKPERFLGRAYGRHEFCPFGIGHYACLGAATTQAFGRALITELVKGYTWETISNGPPEFNAWCHWRPSSRLRIRLRPRN